MRSPGYLVQTRRLAGIVLALGIWEVLSRSDAVADEFMPSLWAVFSALGDFARTAVFWDNVMITLVRALAGLLLALAIAFTLSILAGLSPRMRRMLEPMSDFMRAIPPPALIPLGIFALGLGHGLYLLIITFGCIWPIYISASNALGSPDPVHSNMARTLGLRTWQTMWLVRLPAALPEALTGLRLSASIALLSAVATEMLLGANGLGALVFNAGFSLLWDDMYALMIIIGVMGLCFNILVRVIRQILTGWQLEMVKLGAIS